MFFCLFWRLRSTNQGEKGLRQGLMGKIRGESYLEMKSICSKAFTLFFALVIAMSLLCQATREDVSMQEIYEIDYNGPQTHALPPVAKGSVPDHSGVKNIGKQKKPVHA